MNFEEYVKGFEEVEKLDPREEIELSEENKINYYMFAKMYKKDMAFREFMNGCIELYAIGTLHPLLALKIAQVMLTALEELGKTANQLGIVKEG